MCTVTWLVEPGGYRLFSNRDELRSRRPAVPPSEHREEGARFLAPTDGEAGGTWIAVNEAGVSLCLLNDYATPAVDRRAGSVSRGLLLAGLAGLAAAAPVIERLRREDLGPYRPFHLLALEPREPARVFHWDGRRGALESPPRTALLTSSSFDPAAVDRARRTALARRAGGGALSADDLLAFHRSHEPERGALSPCMHRADARTVSFSHVRVGPRSVSFDYADGPPCTAAARPGGRLPRRRPVSA